jgi:translocator protein
MILPIVIAATIVFLMLGIGAWMTTVGPWYRDLRKPAWNPPDWVFGPAWTLILALAGWAGVSAWINASSAADQYRILMLFGINVILHMLWSPLFFNLRRPDWALIEVPFLWLSIVALMVGLAHMSSLSVWLLSPYLLWVTFAAFLNFTIVRINGSFGTNCVAMDRRRVS